MNKDLLSSNVLSVWVAYISKVECDFQVAPEVVWEIGVHVQHFQQVVSQDLV